MHLRTLVCALGLALTACGGTTARAPIGNQAAATTADPEQVLAAFADALTKDDGAAVAALIDPDHGLRLWFTPGAGYAVYATIAPGDRAAPSTRVRPEDEGAPESWSTYPWQAVAQHITEGLAKLDRDPADPRAPIYGDCGDEDAPVRAYLVHGQSDRDLLSFDLGGSGEVADADVLTDLAVFELWGTRIYLRATPAGWRLVHVALQEVCSA